MVHIPSFFSSSPHSQAALPTVFFPCSLPLSAVSWTAKPVCGVQTASVSINPPGDGRGGVWGWWSGREDEGKTCEEEKGWLVGNAFVHTNCQPCSLTYLHSEWTNDSRCCIHLLSVFTHTHTRWAYKWDVTDFKPCGVLMWHKTTKAAHQPDFNAQTFICRDFLQTDRMLITV